MKKIILIFIAILLTGCKAEVNINISENELTEEIKIYDLKSNVFESGTEIKEDVNTNIIIFEHEYHHYNKEQFEENDYVGNIYTFTSDLSFLGSSISRLTTCYEEMEVIYNNDIFGINTSDEYRCGYMFGGTDVVLNVVSDLKLESSNADRIVENKLTWYINQDNYKNKKIIFKYQLPKQNVSKNNENDEIINNENKQNNEKVDSTYVKIIFYALSIVFLISVLVVYQKIKNSNK